MLLRFIYWTPIFKTRITNPPKHLFLFGGMPFIIGPLKITMGEKCRVSGGSTVFIGRSTGKQTPELIVGNNVGISWDTSIAIGTRVELGDNVRMAEGALLIGFPGHPYNSKDRAQGLADTEDQIGDIILENDVWLGTDVTILPNVRIGQGSIIATRSVVTHDIPPGVIAGGTPARVIRQLDEYQDKNSNG